MAGSPHGVERVVTGKVYLVGAGPGDPGLVTLRAAEIIVGADVVLYDRLVGEGVLAMIPESVEKIYVGRSVGDDASHQDGTNDMMARHAGSGKKVVRLKGGDPIIFGRGGEEAEFLKERGIPYEIVPGITSGVGSATYAGIPLTHRRYSSCVAFVTGHDDPAKGFRTVRWRELAGAADTIVVMMGLSRIETICRELVLGGMNKDTPVAVIQNGTTKDQRTVTGNLADISEIVKREGISAPANIIIGGVVDLADVIGWR